MRNVALAVAGVVLVRLVLNYNLLDYPLGTLPGLNWLLHGYGIPAAAFFLAARWFGGAARDPLVTVLEAGALAFAVLLVTLEIRDPVAEVVTLGGEDSEGIDIEVLTDVFEDFEADDGRFTPTAFLWEHGVPTSGPGAAFSGSQVWATNLEGNYPNRANDSLVSPTFRLRATGQPVLEFQSWFDSEFRDRDRGAVSGI